jgi:hypothetical protein
LQAKISERSVGSALNTIRQFLDTAQANDKEDQFKEGSELAPELKEPFATVSAYVPAIMMVQEMLLPMKLAGMEYPMTFKIFAAQRRIAAYAVDALAISLGVGIMLGAQRNIQALGHKPGTRSQLAGVSANDRVFRGFESFIRLLIRSSGTQARDVKKETLEVDMREKLYPKLRFLSLLDKNFQSRALVGVEDTIMPSVLKLFELVKKNIPAEDGAVKEGLIGQMQELGRDILSKYRQVKDKRRELSGKVEESRDPDF